MAISLNIVLALAATVAKVQAAMGSAFSTGPVADGVRIAESWATLNLPAVPSDNNGDLSLWVGMGTSNGDLIQSIAENYQSSDWSVYAYTLVSTSATSQAVVQGDSSTADVGTAVTFHYKYDTSSGNYTQDVIVGGSIVSTVSTSDGDAQGWGSSVECAAEDCGTVPAHTWTNVSIILSEADSTYQNTLALGTGVTATMTSEDDITFTVGTIHIPGWDFSTESVTDDTSSSTSSSSPAASSGVSASYTSPDASPSGVSGSGSGSGSGSYGGSSSGSEGAAPSGTATSGSYGGSSTWGGAGSQSSGSAGSKSSGGRGKGHGSGSKGSSSWGSSGARPSGSFGGSSTGSSSGAQPSGGFGGYTGSSTGSSSGAQSSEASSWGSWGNSNAAWQRSRISRHQGGN